MNDTYKEHEQFHTSEDWANLKKECSECFKMCEKYGRGIDIQKSPRSYQLEDLHFLGLKDRFN